MFKSIVIAFGLVYLCAVELVWLAPANEACRQELLNANKSMAAWAQSMEEMVNESKLTSSVRELVHNEANIALDAIEDFGARIERDTALKLAQDLVNIRRRCNRLALDVYLRTFDMRWPQNSLQLGVIVERVQQACLDRRAIEVLESPASPLQ